MAAIRLSIREHAGEASSRQANELLDERLAHRRVAHTLCKAIGPIPEKRRCHERNFDQSQAN